MANLTQLTNRKSSKSANSIYLVNALRQFAADSPGATRLHRRLRERNRKMSVNMRISGAKLIKRVQFIEFTNARVSFYSPNSTTM